MFNLDYLVDNGRLRNWETDIEPDCTLVQWRDDDSYSVLDSSGNPLGCDDTPEGAKNHARRILTDRRRIRDGVIPARIG